METLKERVSAYCKRKNISIYKFEKDSGLSNGYFNQVKTRPSDDKLMSIHRAFPDLNVDWLSTGQGEMISMNGIETHASGNANVVIGSGKISNNDDVQLAVLKSENEMLRAQLDDKDKQIEFLKSLINK